MIENKIISEKNFSEKLQTVNRLLNAEKLGQIVETKEYLFFFGKYDKKMSYPRLTGCNFNTIIVLFYCYARTEFQS